MRVTVYINNEYPVLKISLTTLPYSITIIINIAQERGGVIVTGAH